MKENIRIDISERNHGKKQIIINRKYKNLIFQMKRKIIQRYIDALNHIFNEISQDMGLICLEFNSIRTQIIRSRNKQLLPDITTFEEIPGESEYYKTENAKLFIQYNDNIFEDGTFYIAPKFSYQVFITRTYVEKINSFYTTSISILKDKKQSTYETLFKKIIKKKCDYFKISIY
ncbi:hypothetical protein U3516DRAFT_849774 [Neocallimastix sp. 'constans']